MNDQSHSPTLGNLNRLDQVMAAEEATHTMLPAKAPPTLLLMTDIETLSLANRPVITEVCLMGYDLENDEFLDVMHHQFYDVDPQLAIIPPRSIQGKTISYRMKESDEVRANFDQCTGTDFEDLVSVARGFIRVFEQLTQNNPNYVFMSARPQFDVNAIGTLLTELGLTPPWAYDSIMDLRSLQRELGINYKNTPIPTGAIPHTAIGDVRWQVAQYLDVKRKVAGGA